MVSGVATYCMIIGLCIGLIIIAFIIHRTVKNKREKRKNKQEHSLEENSESQGIYYFYISINTNKFQAKVFFFKEKKKIRIPQANDKDNLDL